MCPGIIKIKCMFLANKNRKKYQLSRPINCRKKPFTGLVPMKSGHHLNMYSRKGGKRTKTVNKIKKHKKFSLWAVSSPLADLSFHIPVLFYNDSSSSVFISHQLANLIEVELELNSLD